MKKNLLTYISTVFFVTVFLGSSLNTLKAQEFKHEKLWSFEQLNKKDWIKSKGSSLSLSAMHYKHGQKSLNWSWKKDGSITLKQDIGFVPFDAEGEDKSIPSFAVWVYNETPINDHVTFIFGTDEVDNCQFTFGLNYKGWRAAWVSYERDMEGTPVSSMNRLRIETPEGISKGQLFFDHMFLCQPIDSRHHTPDFQVPNVNAKTTNNWLVQQKASLMKPDLDAPQTLSEETKAAFRLIEQRYTEDILKKQRITKKSVESLKKQVDRYQIVRHQDQISGKPIWFGRNAELYIPVAGRSIAKLYRQNKTDLKTYFNVLASIANAYVNCESTDLKAELRQMYMDMYDHMVDQGVAEGSGWGTIHHYGYNWRGYYKALFLMRDVLAEENKLEEAVAGMQWYSAIGETFHKPEKYGIDMDAFNTMVMGRLGSVLIMEDSPLKVQYLNSFSRWVDNGLMPAPGLDDSFKIDGSSYHHANHYPAYATGGMNGAVRMVYFMSGTPFQVSKQGHATLKKALLTMRFYCNLTQWPLSMSGRHPEGVGALKTDHYAILAKAGTPDGSSNVDKELASAYLRLVQNNTKEAAAKEFIAQGIKAEETPAGHITMPYASSSVHRRNEWAASVRGHSRYLWASEQYLGANLYGRYLAHGQLQVMGKGSPVNHKSSGFVQKGWDWNRFPGTTVINLPIDDLRADIRNVDQFSGYEEMLFSDEAFAGGVNADSTNGIYAFILHEHDKYQGSLRGRKSYFFFDNIVVCLGSGIENTNQDRPTETILFQNHMGKEDPAVSLNGLAVTEDEKQIEANMYWMMDNKNNGYLIPDGKVYFKQGLQHSRDESSEKPTEGNFTAAIIQHGKAPKDASYHYCLVPCTNKSMVKELAANPSYKVLSQSSQKHIVSSDETGEIAYVFFETAEENDLGIIKSTNMPCMAISKQNENKLNLHVVNPDLALYSGPADEIYKDGKRVERSIYSRPWRSHESQETTLKIELKGKWEAPDSSVQLKITEEDNTIITFICKDGLTESVELRIVK
ncbi:chondroitinase [Labilibacter sediminis]|nr:chondroitinase [Labilibacter sediminis]